MILQEKQLTDATTYVARMELYFPSNPTNAEFIRRPAEMLSPPTFHQVNGSHFPLYDRISSMPKMRNIEGGDDTFMDGKYREVHTNLVATSNSENQGIVHLGYTVQVWPNKRWFGRVSEIPFRAILFSGSTSDVDSVMQLTQLTPLAEGQEVVDWTDADIDHMKQLFEEARR